MTRWLLAVLLCALPAVVHAEAPGANRGDGPKQEEERNLFTSIFAIPAAALAVASVASLLGSAAITAVVQADRQLVEASRADAQRQQLLQRTPVDLHVLALVLVAAALGFGTGAIVLTVLHFVWPLKLADINRRFNRSR